MSTTVKSKRNSTSDQENSLSDVESEKQPVSSNEETENQDDDTDDGGNWKFRPPPRGFTIEESYSLCPNIGSTCSFGDNCVDAHSEGELAEWKERFEIRKNEEDLVRSKKGEKTYTENLLEILHQSSDASKILQENIAEVEVTCSNETTLSVSSKACKREWIFVLKTTKLLKAVSFLQDEHRIHFTIKRVYPKHPNRHIIDHSKNKLSCQEWLANYPASKECNNQILSHRVKINFSTDIYGTFRQTICFEFYELEMKLVRNIYIDVMPLEDFGKVQDIKNDIVSLARTRWNSDNSELVFYSLPKVAGIDNSSDEYDKMKEREMLDKYPLPKAEDFVLSQNIIRDKLNEKNYREWMHTMLYVEEMARFDLIAKFNLNTILKISNNYIITPNSLATSTAKYSNSGELFGVLTLAQDISEDTSEGALILNNCNSLFFIMKKENSETKQTVYEALIEDKSKNVIYLKLSAEIVQMLQIKNNDEIKVDIQFQPNRLTYCEWHLAVDRNQENYPMLFPDTTTSIDTPWNPNLQFDHSLDPRLNSKQKEAVISITTPSDKKFPPFLLIGPFGTGKTFTLAQIIKRLLTQDDSKILICTHSNSAADLYIREYLHPWVESGLEEAKPLRIYYHKRWPSTVNQIVQKYCLIETKGNARYFVRPTREDIMKHKIIVVTLSTSMEICSLNIDKGAFTHILLDEAAQSLECESITPLALADENTRIVLAGDHMQMTPEVYSNFAREKNFQISLLERLYNHYSENYQTKILLCENYRAHDVIIKFTSDLFYDQKLISSGNQPSHSKFHPLTFFTARGEDVQDINSTAFYNNAEVYEIVERVGELKRRWPPAWGKFNETSIGILTPYADQVFRIRSELRKKKLSGISVERILNVQGKQFRAVFLSTVRTRLTCSNKREDADYGFLSNTKLLNTAITRAQSLVSVIGDPIALCSVGRCRKIWEKFIEICYKNKSLYGISWSTLKSQLDNVEMRKTYILNPLAPEFIPRQFNNESYLREQIIKAHRNNPMYMNHQPHFNQNFMPNRQNLRSPMQMNPQPMARPIINPYRHQQMMNMHPQQQQFPPFPGNFPNGPSNFQNRTPPIWMNQNLPPPGPPQQPHPSNLIGQNNSFPFPGYKNGINNSAWPFLPPPQAPQQHVPPIPNLRPSHFRPPVPVVPQNPIFTNPNPPQQPHIMSYFNQQSQLQQNQQYQQQPMFPVQPKPPSSTTNDYFNREFNFIGMPSPQQQIQQVGNGSENGAKFDKDYHFLQNVHFPEQVNEMSDRRLQQTNAYLLPPNCNNFQDLVNKPKDFQFFWFRKIFDRFGSEEADKFVELLKHFSQSNRQISAVNVAKAPMMSTQQQQPTVKSVDNIEESLLASLTKEFENETPKESLFYSNFSENNLSGGIDPSKNEKPSIPLYLRTRNKQ